MKAKKLISLVLSAAISLSAFCSLAAGASAADGSISYADGTVTVKSDDAENGVLIIASYEENKLVGLEIKPLAFTDNTAEVSELALTKGTKLMAWKDIDSMEPICEPVMAEDSSETQQPATQQPATEQPATQQPATEEPSDGIPHEDVIAQTPTGEEAVYIGETKYNTINEALNAAPTAASEGERVYIDIMPGVYREQIRVSKPYITFRKKEGTEGNVKLTWYYGQGSTYYSCSGGYYTPEKQQTGGVPSNWGATLNVQKEAVGFTAENLILENSYNRYYTQEELTDLAGHDPNSGNSNFKRLEWLKDSIAKGVSDEEINTKLKTREVDIAGYDGAGGNEKFSPRERSAALYTNADKIQFKNCLIISTQDTIGINDNRVYFENCRLGGTTDYICGSASGAVFNNCELYTNAGRDTEGATITAPRNNAGTKGYLFWNCRITGTEYAKDGSMGRPWGGASSGAAYVNTIIEKSRTDSTKLLVGETGWSSMSENMPEDAQFCEFGSVTEDGTPVNVSNRRGKVLGEWEVLAYNPYNFLKGSDDWDPMGVKEIWTKIQEDVNAVTIADSETVTKQEDGSYEVSGEFTLPSAPAGYDIHFESASEYLTVNGDKVTAVRPIEGTSSAALTVYLRKSDDKTVGASGTINITITADSTVDPAAFAEAMAEAKKAVTDVMGTGENAVLDRAVSVPSVADKGDVKTTIKIETEGKVNSDGTIERNPYASEAAEGKVRYIIECMKGATILRENIEYNVTIPSKKGDLLYADFEDNATAVGGAVKTGGSNSGYYVNGAVNANFAMASSKSPVTVEFDVKKADTTVTVGKYTKTITASEMQDGWNKVKVVIDTAAKTMTTTLNGTAGGAEAVADGEASVSKIALNAGDYDNITVYEGENNADGAKVYTTMWKASAADGGKPNGTILMRGMTVTDTITTLKTTSAEVDGEKFTHYISSGNNGSYKNNKFSGAGIGFKFVAPADGEWTVYVTALKNKTFAIGSNEDATVTKTTSGTADKAIDTSLTIKVEAGKTYYATVDGSKGSFLGAKFVPDTEGDDKYEPPKPVAGALNIEVDFKTSANKYFNKDGSEVKQDDTATFSLDKDGNIVADDAENAVAKFENIVYHNDHGVRSGTITIKAPSYTKITVGGCQFGNTVELKKDNDIIDKNECKVCWSGPADKVNVSSVYYKEADAAELTLPIKGYWPYVTIESITENELPNDVTATFELDETDTAVQGIVPDKVTVIKGATITIPENASLYKEGYTLTGWTDGTTTYNIGRSVTLTETITLKPVFTENTKTTSKAYTVTWEFNLKHGFPSGITWQSKNGIFVAQADIDGEKQDVKLDVDTTTNGGKFYVRDNDTQTNEGTTYIIPAIEGSVVTFSASEDVTKHIIGDTTFNRTEATEPKSYTVAAEDIVKGKITMKNVGGRYTKSITVTYPAAAEETTPEA